VTATTATVATAVTATAVVTAAATVATAVAAALPAAVATAIPAITLATFGERSCRFNLRNREGHGQRLKTKREAESQGGDR
jgi:hypothetical protein